MNYTDPGGHDKCVIGDDGRRYCILDNGAIIDTQHYDEILAKRFWAWLNDPNRNDTFTFTQYTYGHEFSVTYKVAGSLAELSSDQLRSLGADIWLDYQNRFEQWQCDEFFDITGTAFSPEDIPSTMLAFAVISATGPDEEKYSFSDAVDMLGGGKGSNHKPIGYNGIFMPNSTGNLMTVNGQYVDWGEVLTIDHVESETSFQAINTSWGFKENGSAKEKLKYSLSRFGNFMEQVIRNYGTN